MPAYAHVVALAALADLGKADDAFVRAGYEAIAADPDEGTAPLLNFLEKRGDLRGRPCGGAGGRSSGTASAKVSAWRICRPRRRGCNWPLGDPEGAFATLQPALEVYKEETPPAGRHDRARAPPRGERP